MRRVIVFWMLCISVALWGCDSTPEGSDPSDSSQQQDTPSTGNDTTPTNDTQTTVDTATPPPTGSSVSACQTWVEGTEDDDDGATRDFYNRAAGLPWRNQMGDWHDADGTAQGNNPFAMTTLTDDNTPEYIEWDAGTLVTAWIDGDLPNTGMLLRSVSGAGTYNFYSRDHSNPDEHPELVVTTTDQGDVTLSPTADTSLEESTYQGFGDSDRLRISESAPILMRFDLSQFAPGTVTGARLRIFVYQEYGDSTQDVGVFLASPGPSGPPPEPTPGLAANYPGDAGIAGDPNVLLFSDFEAANWGDDWTSGADASTLELVTSDVPGGFEAFAGQALRVKVPGGSNTGMNVRFDFQDEVGEEPDEIYMRYYVRISEDWLPSDGGKFPGISGTYGVAGWGGRPVDGTDGWSARGTYREPAPMSADNPFSGHTPIGNYVYHADMGGQYGDVELYLDHCGGILGRSQWYSVEQYLKMNTPGQNDGIIRAWVDGRLAHEKTDWRWRDVSDLKIERIWMNIYHGGTDTPPSDIHLYIDNVVIAREYIGPMAP